MNSMQNKFSSSSSSSAFRGTSTAWLLMPVYLHWCLVLFLILNRYRWSVQADCVKSVYNKMAIPIVCRNFRTLDRLSLSLPRLEDSSWQMVKCWHCGLYVHWGPSQPIHLLVAVPGSSRLAWLTKGGGTLR
jgi:hypothetical protein